jgi:hypothetical protein
MIVFAFGRAQRLDAQPSSTESAFAFFLGSAYPDGIGTSTSRTSAMTLTELIDGKNAQIGEIPNPTIGVFAHAAVVANLLVAAIVVFVFSMIALKEHALGDLQLMLWLIPFVTVVVWTSASAI